MTQAADCTTVPMIPRSHSKLTSTVEVVVTQMASRLMKEKVRAGMDKTVAAAERAAQTDNLPISRQSK